MIDITMTAVVRPEILERTLASFARNLFKSYKDYGTRLIINIDPVGGDEVDLESMIDVIEQNFNSYTVRVAKIPNFAKAFKWCWQQVTAPYVFNLEDDWELLRPISIKSLLASMESKDDLAIMRLPAFTSNDTAMKNWNKFYPWNGEYFECPENLKTTTGFCGHPSLIKFDFVDKIRKHLVTDRNPEKQFHTGSTEIAGIIRSYDYGVHGKLSTTPYIRDIGRQWLANTDWQKKGNKAHFLEWEKEIVLTK